MDRFIMHHQDRILGTLSCFDRLIFKGHLQPISYAAGLEKFFASSGTKLKEFKRIVTEAATRMKQHAQALAAQAARPYEYLTRPQRKEELARRFATRLGVERGLICVLATIEPVNSFRLLYGDGRPRLQPAWRKCLVHYFYLIDSQFGFMHVRRPTWFPFTMQVYINGHEWLARRMNRLRMRFRRLENAFVSIGRPERADRLARDFAKLDWPAELDRFAHRFNPLLHDVLQPMQYYWVTDQAEYSTDVMFSSRADLQAIYPSLLHHATMTFRANDIMTFLGRKLHPAFKGEVVSDLKHRVEGARLKHRVGRNWIKMYDKHGRVLRVETVINQPREFKVRRVTTFQGRTRARWCPMPKSVAFLDRTERICRASNRRYLDGLAGVKSPEAARKALDRMAARSTVHKNRRHRGFNPADPFDAKLFDAVLRGEHVIAGFRNRHVREALFGITGDRLQARRQAARVTRLFNRLHAHGYIAKIPRTHRWKLTDLGRAAMSAVLDVRDNAFPAAFAKVAA